MRLLIVEDSRPVSERLRAIMASLPGVQAEVRMYEAIEGGAPVTPFLHFGDRVHIEMLDASGQSIFGAIDQTVRCVQAPA